MSADFSISPSKRAAEPALQGEEKRSRLAEKTLIFALPEGRTLTKQVKIVPLSEHSGFFNNFFHTRLKQSDRIEIPFDLPPKILELALGVIDGTNPLAPYLEDPNAYHSLCQLGEYLDSERLIDAVINRFWCGKTHDLEEWKVIIQTWNLSADFILRLLNKVDPSEALVRCLELDAPGCRAFLIDLVNQNKLCFKELSVNFPTVEAFLSYFDEHLEKLTVIHLPRHWQEIEISALLKRTPQLISLQLVKTQLSPQALKGLAFTPSLQQLRLEGVKLEEDALRYLPPQLKFLTLIRPPVSTTTVNLKYLSSIRDLVLLNYNLQTLNAPNVQALKCQILEHNSLIHIKRSNLPRLTQLHVFIPKRLGDFQEQLWDGIISLNTNLKKFSINMQTTQPTYIQHLISHLTHLESLRLSTDFSFPDAELSLPSSLKELAFHDANLQENTLRKLAERVPDLEELTIQDNNAFSQDLLRDFFNFPHLKVLKINIPSLQQAAFVGIGETFLPNLRELHVPNSANIVGCAAQIKTWHGYQRYDF